MDIAVDTDTRLEIRRRFRASVAAVYAAWTDPQEMKRWMGPVDGMASEVTSDLREGGRYRIVMHAPSGETHRVGGVFREVHPGRKLVYTWAWESTPDRESLVTVLFEPAPEGTELVLIHQRFADRDARDRHRVGWDGCFDRLDRFLTT